MTVKINNTYERILTTALKLFYQKGIPHVGINEVIAASCVAKQTFYNHFPSKEQLILEVMLYQQRQWLQWFEEAVETRGKTATEKLLATFDVLEEWYAKPDFQGCPFINAVVQLANVQHPVHQIAVNLRHGIRTQIIKLAKDAGVRDPEAFSQQYLLLIGGASLMATIERTPTGAEYARQVLSILLDANLK